VLCGYHLAHIRPAHACHGPFLARAFSAVGPRDQFQVAANGITRFGLGGDAIATGVFALPPEPEQRAIAAFLDRETARIDALMAKKERLIELLQEKRTALITRAVTKGLPSTGSGQATPTVPMKDSGVEWLGEIPAHWEVSRIKWAAKMVSGHTPDKKIDSYWQGGDIPWVSLADTGQLREVDYIATTAVMTTSDGIAHSSAHVLPEGTVVFSRDATIGLCAITRAGMAVSQHFIGWVCGSRLRPEYLLLVLRSMTQELERLTMGATVRTIGMPDVKSLATPIPPLAEQERIVREVLHRRARLDALVCKVRDAIERLKELRTALISAAVTGKIDVREEIA
jgi:type I restriction enzyme S subunit